MVLTRADDFPVHQTCEPIAYAGSDRNFYDRYFFNGYSQERGDKGFFALAFGVYPHLNIADAAFTVVREGVQTALHASRWLQMERLDLTAGPISICVVEPLQTLRLRVEAPDQGLRADLTFSARSAPIEEPRFVRRLGPRTLFDYTRMTQNGRYAGWIELDGERQPLQGWVGTRDRSWGVRPIGARDLQALAPAASQQFFWLWSPANLADGSFFFHVNDDEGGRPWNTRACFSADGCSQLDHQDFDWPRARVEWRSGSRHARFAVVALDDRDPGAGAVSFTPIQEVFMLGLGYGHPTWGHGLNHGELAVEREDLNLSKIDVSLPQHLHVQALAEVSYLDRAGRTREGRGVFEQLVLGPHAPSGFAGLLDLAP